MTQPADVRAGLQALVPYLKQFVLQHLEKKYGPGFRQRLSRPGGRPFSDTDPRALIKAALSEWEAAFRGHTPSHVKQYLHLLREVANRHAHHDAISADEAYHALVTIRLLALSIGGDAASSDFDPLLPSPPPAALKTAGAQQPIRTPSRAQSGESDAVLDPQFLDAHSAVNKAVLCPACRSKVFKVWPLGWDAHAAFACSGLDLSDPEARKRDFRTRFAKLFR